MQTIDQLNADFGIAGKLEFVTGNGDLTMLKIETDLATATISTYAGQVLSFLPKGHQHDLLFLSDSAYYATGKAIKGGVPICWPWFGPDPEEKGRPGHGFVRNRQWEVRETEETDQHIKVTLGVPVSDETRAIWPFEFDLSIEITVGASLEIALITKNLGAEPITVTQGLHTYFAVGDIAQVEVLGLENTSYIDKLDDSSEKTQQGAIIIDAEADRIYFDVADNTTITDQAWKRNISITSTGSNSSVVWNPWIDTAAKMADLGDDDYQRMICVETTNAGPDVVSIAGNSEYRLAAHYRID